MPIETNESKKKLTFNQEAFCKLYVSKEYFGNGTQAYMAAYGCEYDSAKTDASRTLTDANVLKRIHELMDAAGWNDATMDNAVLFTALQVDDLPSKMRAVSEYNKIRGRYAPEKKEHGMDDPMKLLMEKLLDMAEK